MFQKLHEDADLTYFKHFATQRDKSESVPYAEDYFNKYVAYENSEISKKLNQGRVQITEKYCKKALLDVGIGSGEFIKCSKLKVYGTDINEVAIDWLKFHKLYVDPYKAVPSDVDGWTFWDSLEHFREPQDILTKIPEGNYVFISMPIFHNIMEVKASKHYRPNEHYYYFTSIGLMEYMKQGGFTLVEHNDQESKAGRDQILTFVFWKHYPLKRYIA